MIVSSFTIFLSFFPLYSFSFSIEIDRVITQLFGREGILSYDFDFENTDWIEGNVINEGGTVSINVEAPKATSGNGRLKIAIKQFSNFDDLTSKISSPNVSSNWNQKVTMMFPSVINKRVEELRSKLIDSKEILDLRLDSKLFIIQKNIDNSKASTLMCPDNSSFGAPQGQDWKRHLCFINSWNIFEAYSSKNNAFVNSVKFGFIDKKQTALVADQLFNIVYRRKDFGGIELTAVAQYGSIFIAKFSDDNETYVDGFQVDQADFLSRSYNFRIRALRGKGWLQLDDPNLEKDGMAGQVIRGEADLSISSSELLDYGQTQLKFLHPTYYSRMEGFFVQPPASSIRDIFVHAFTADLWITMFSTWILIVLAMWSVSFVKSRRQCLEEDDATVVNEVVIWCIGFMCQQGWHTCPESMSLKIIFLFASVMGLVSYVAYSAALVSILSVKVKPIKSLNDMITLGYTLLTDEQILATEFVIKDLRNDGMDIRYSSGNNIRAKAAIAPVLNSKAALIGVADVFYPRMRKRFDETEICHKISFIRINHNPILGGMFLKRDSPYVDFFNSRIALLYERGIRNRLLKMYDRDTSVFCLDHGKAKKEPLNYNDVFTAFLILVFGYAISFVVFLIEYFIFPPKATTFRLDPYNIAN